MKKFILLLLFIMVMSCVIPPVKRWAESGIGQHISSIEISDQSEGSYASSINWKKKFIKKILKTYTSNQ